jgi:hypothetical protein
MLHVWGSIWAAEVKSKTTYGIIMTTSAVQPLFATQAKRHRVPRSRQKSAVSNGTRLLPGTDNRNVWARRCKDIMENLTADRGGADEVTAAEASIIRRAAVLSVELESLEAKFAEAGQATDRDLDLYGRTSGNLRRLLETLGLDRRSKIIGGTLSDYLNMPAETEDAEVLP